MSAGGGRARRAAALVVAAALVACTGDDGAAEGSTTTAAVGVEVDAGTIRLGVGGPLVLDPLEASMASPSDLMVLDLLHGGLTELDADGVAQPGLASSWTADDALKVWRFELDPEATFTGGRPVTADDVVASLSRAAAAGDTSLAALALEPVAGFRSFLDGGAEVLLGVGAVDESTVQIILEQPLSVLPELLAGPVFGVVDPDGLDTTAPVELTGAWTVEEGDDTALVARRRSGAGTVGTVVLQPFPGPEEAYDAFDAGEVDWALVPPSRFGDALDDHGDDHFAPFHAELFFGMNLGAPPLSNADLRAAIVAAIDRDAIVDSVYSALADPLPGLVPVGVAGYEPGECDTCGHDPDRAESLLAEAFPDGEVPEVRIDFDESPAQEAMAELVAADLEAVGIPTSLRPLPLEEYKRFVVAGDQKLFSFGWIGVYGSPDAYLAPLFISDSDDNLSRFRSEAVDGLLARARSGADRAQNGERWTEAEARVLSESVVVPIAQFRTQAVVADRIEGLVHAVDGTVDWGAVVAVRGR
jgi:ABC-type transport system substrate-binding protein